MNLAIPLPADHKLTANALNLLWALRRKARGNPECWASARTLARAIGVVERTVQRLLAQFQALGLVAIDRDYAIRTRRRIRLLFLGTPAPPPDGRQIVAQAPDDLSPGTPIPPDPPLEEPEGKSRGEEDDDDETATVSGSMMPAVPSTTHERSSSSHTPTISHPGKAGKAGEGNRRATPAEVAETIALAEEIFGPGMGERVRLAARGLGGLARVRLATERARGKGKGWGYALGTLRNWLAEGGPTPVPPVAATAGPPAPRPSKAQAREAEWDRQLAAVKAWQREQDAKGEEAGRASL